MGSFGIGASVRRKEDLRFLTGKGKYTDDINRPGQLQACLLRSPHAHAEIAGIDTAKAMAAPGVAAIFTGADLQAPDLKLGALPCGWLITSKDGSPMAEPPRPLLAHGKVRHVGDPVVVVVAETRGQAEAAAELIEIAYKELPAVVAADEAIKPGGPRLFDAAPGNLCFDWHLGDKAAVDTAFARAHHITRLDLVNNRLVSNPMEPRAAIGEHDSATGDYTLYTTSQAPHVHRLLIAAFVLQLPEHKLRVVAPDVGGGFGTKGSLYNEQALVLWLAARLGRPVKWTADRSEIFLTDNQARDHLTQAELALDADGKFLAMRVATLANLGAYLGSFAPAIPTWCYGTLLAGNYATPAIYVEVKGVFTNTAPVDAYRGAGRPEACYVVERLVDRAAREMKIDPVALRRRNFVANDAFPYTTPVALTYDSGDYFKTLDMALEAADYSGFEQRRQEAAARGKLRGIGIATYIEARAMRRPSPSLSRTASALPSTRSILCTGTPPRSRSAWGPMPRARWPWAAPRWSRPWTRSSTRARKSPPICSRRPRRISSSPTASLRWPVPIARRPSRRSPSPPMSRTIFPSRRWNPASTRPPSTIRRTSPIPPAAISPRSRSIARPGPWRSRGSPAPTISGASSIR